MPAQVLGEHSIVAKALANDAVNATAIKNNFGTFLTEARLRPVEISKSGRVVAVLVGIEEFRRIRAIEDAALLAQVREAEGRGRYLSAAETRRALAGILERAGGTRGARRRTHRRLAG